MAHDDDAKRWREKMAAAIAPVLDELQQLEDAEAVVSANHANVALLDAQGEVAMFRRAKVRSLRAAGLTLREIGEQTGLTPQRVGQIEAGIGRSERRTRGGRING